MELNITYFFNQAAPMDYSASVAEIGRNAGADTWAAACEDAPDYPILDTEEKRQAFRDHVKGFGAWSDDEISAWSENELSALLIQLIAGDIREAGLDQSAPDWEAYDASGDCGRIFLGTDGCVYYYIGS